MNKQTHTVYVKKEVKTRYRDFSEIAIAEKEVQHGSSIYGYSMQKSHGKLPRDKEKTCSVQLTIHCVKQSSQTPLCGIKVVGAMLDIVFNLFSRLVIFMQIVIWRRCLCHGSCNQYVNIYIKKNNK